MKPAGRKGDRSLVPTEQVQCPACGKPSIGPATTASNNVLINQQNALRVGDQGTHEACHGSKVWKASRGAPRVLINNQHAHRLGDIAQHQGGGKGKLVEGSPNVLIGDYVHEDGPHWFILKCSQPNGAPVAETQVSIIAPDGQVLDEANNGWLGHHIKKINAEGPAKVRITIKRPSLRGQRG